MRVEDVTDKLRVVDLRAELVKLGLETNGTKPVLLARLKEALAAGARDRLPEPTDEGCHDAVEDAEAHMEKVRTSHQLCLSFSESGATQSTLLISPVSFFARFSGLGEN